jgi:hypothetical protein
MRKKLHAVNESDLSWTFGLIPFFFPRHFPSEAELGHVPSERRCGMRFASQSNGQRCPLSVPGRLGGTPYYDSLRRGDSS